jgi:transcriptional regulator with XRE-family HTH domain
MTTQRVDQGWVPEDSFGGRLALIRQHYGWNVKEAAVNCRIAVESWRNWERDHVLPSRYLDVVRTIADATGADYDWLLDGRRFPSPRSAHTTRYAERVTPHANGNNLTLRNELVAPSLDETRAA